MDPIYVTGHRNPDTDSIVAAIAYASLRNALGDREYTDVSPKDNEVFLSEVMSRKKQVIPSLSALWG